MNKTFDIKRFGRVVSNDLSLVWQNYGYSFIVLMLMPAIFCFFYTMFPIVFGGEVDLVRPWGRIVVLFITIFAFTVSFPNKVYGHITEKKAGTAFLMLPASTLEKFASMVLVSAVIAPAILLAGFWIVDSILTLTGAFIGGNLFTFINDLSINKNEFLSVNVWNAGFGSLALNMLVFLLGAIYFKKSKAARTILCLMAIAMVFSMVFGAFISWVVDSPDFFNFDESAITAWIERHIDNAEFYVNLVLNTIRFGEAAIILGLIYLRVKTLKH